MPSVWWGFIFGVQEGMVEVRPVFQGDHSPAEGPSTARGDLGQGEKIYKGVIWLKI